MWPAVVFICLVLLVIADSLWKERRLRKQRLQARQEFTAALLRQQQDAYAHARAQQRALFDSMIDGVLVLDQAGRIQLVNDSVRRLFELGPGGGQGNTVLETFRSPELADLAERLPKVKSVLGYELELPKTPPRFLEVNANAVHSPDGSYGGAILVFHDLTHVRELQATRREFVANVSHELRTPLSLIHGFVETLLEGAKEDPAVATRYLKTIQKHTDRLRFLIDDLLRISHLESGQVALKQESISPRAVADRVIDDLRSKADEKQVQVTNEIPAELLVWADAERLEQVLCNLVENAIKYGRPEGIVNLGGEARPGQQIELWVRDNGPGIPHEHQPRIFERFYRVDRARSRETGGTGLGLAIVKHIVLVHGGTVWVKSEPGQGASFHFTMPAGQNRESDGVPSAT